MIKVLFHFLFWAFWFVVFNFNHIAQQGAAPWGPAVYHFISIVFVFYISGYLAMRYLKRISLTGGLKTLPRQWFRYFFLRREVAGWLALVVLHVYGSWIAEQWFAGQEPDFSFSPAFRTYAGGLIFRTIVFMNGGMAFALITEILRRKNEIIARKNAYISSLDAHLQAEKFDNEFLRKSLDEDAKRMKLLEAFYDKHLR